MAERQSKRYKTDTRSSSTSAAPGTSSSSSAAAAAPTSTSAGTSSSSSRSTTSRLTNFHRAIFQILSSFGCIPDQDLKVSLTQIKRDFQPQELGIVSPSPQVPISDAELRTLFSEMNRELRKLNFEIKTLAFPKKNLRAATSSSTTSASASSSSAPADNDFIIYHGLVNTIDDKEAEEYGSRLDVKEITFFKTILENLLASDKQKLSTSDIQEFRVKGTLQSTVEEMIQKLEEERWLARDDRNFVIIGPRTFLELKTTLEAIIENSPLISDKDDEEDERERKIVARKGTLPQILLH